MISESKLDDSFPEGQFFIDGHHTPFQFDGNTNDGGNLLHVGEDRHKSKLFTVTFLQSTRKFLIPEKCMPCRDIISDIHRMIASVLKVHFQKLSPRITSYRVLSNYHNTNSMNSLNEVLLRVKL